MLRELHIQNLAVIDEVSIEFGEGLNCFTGQTGAGKSLIIGAFEYLLGMRGGADMVRSGAPEAHVTGMFELRDPWIAEQVSTAIDQQIAPGDDLLITRRLGASGRSSVSVNGRPVTAAMLKAAGHVLVDVHGQHDHQFLLKPSNQLLVLDAFANCLDDSRRFAELTGQWRALVRQRQSLAQQSELRDRQRDLFEFQLEEIDGAAPQQGEWAELQARHDVLSNLERIAKEAGAAHGALHESEGSIIERLAVMSQVLGDLAELDPRLKQTADQVRSATALLQESAFELRHFMDRLDADPGELTEVHKRLDELNRLIAKYGDKTTGGDPLDSVLGNRDRTREALDRLRGESEEAEGLDGRIEALADEIGALGADLSRKRRKAAGLLVPAVAGELRELGMAEASFDMAFGDAQPPGGQEAPGMLETAQMLVRANPGQPARPLQRVASGGEMSRIMLAIKSVLSTADRVSVLVFDEVDSNVGGRMGTIIGRKLKKLASGRGGAAAHQVLCITHLPQIAAFADRHIHITKNVTGRGAGRQTRTHVTMLDKRSRVAELAEMLAGRNATATTRRQARELLEVAKA
jgi:DNA repair protein RecN (Recombination protein N)